MIATMKGLYEAVELLVKDFNAKVNIKENDGHTPFMAACAGGFLNIVKFYVNETNAINTTKNFEG